MTRLSFPQPWRLALALATAAFCAVWLSQTWTLSSYGSVLQALGAAETGLVLGTPRGGSSDEWGQTTPLTQATVNNGFQRYNRTSFYGEDLRLPYSMPLFDWALAFKPDKWLYPFVNPAYAFSFQWLFHLLAFGFGYTLLFRRLGFAAVESAALTLVLYFTAFVQFWWMLYAPTFALFPWVLLAPGIRRPALRYPAVAWTTAAWMLGHFYPPLFITLAPLGAAIAYRLYGDAPRRELLLSALALAGGALVAALYLRVPMAAMAATIYPGHRRTDGGGVSGEMLAQLLWPAGWLVDFKSTIGSVATLNDLAVVGTCYTLFTLAFLDYACAFGAATDRRTRVYLAALVAVLAVLTAWQVLPIPRVWAMWTGLPLVPPGRTMFASGVAGLLVAAHASALFGLRFSAGRFAVLAAAVLLGWGVGKANLDVDWASRVWPDLVVLPIAAVVLLPHPAIRSNRPTVVACCCALWGAIAFGGYNPLQSAWPIFNRPSTPMTKLLDYQATLSPDETLVSDKFGAVLNGWGYRSVAHIQMVPQLDLWRRYFPDLPPAEFDRLFNRFAHVVPIDEPAPRFLQAHVIGVPRRPFEKDIRWPVATTTAAGPVAHAHASGHVDTLTLRDGRLVVAGWAPWRGLGPGQGLKVYSDIGLDVVRFERTRREDVVRVMNGPALEFSGFVLQLQPSRPLADLASLRLCVVAEEPAYPGGVLLGDGVRACARPGS